MTKKKTKCVHAIREQLQILVLLTDILAKNDLDSKRRAELEEKIKAAIRAIDAQLDRCAFASMGK